MERIFIVLETMKWKINGKKDIELEIRTMF